LKWHKIKGLRIEGFLIQEMNVMEGSKCPKKKANFALNWPNETKRTKSGTRLPIREGMRPNRNDNGQKVAMGTKQLYPS